MIAVTGGAGFIGSHLVRRLREAGGHVRVIDRRGAADVNADITNRGQIFDALKGCRQVYHLAADPNLWETRRGHFHKVNYLGTRNVLDAALHHSAEKILHCSTESILTRASQTEAIREDIVISPGDVIGPYCKSKYMAERYAFELSSRGAPIVIVNPTLPVGPGDVGCSPPTRMIKDFLSGGCSAYVDAEVNLIDVRDVAEGMIRAMSVGESGRRYLLGAENWTIKAIFDFLAEEAGLPKPRWRVPFGVALGAAYVSEWIADVFTGRSPAATITGVKLTKRTMRFDASRSVAELGLVMRSVKEALREAIACSPLPTLRTACYPLPLGESSRG